MPGRLEGKVCILTGSAGSMGRETALLFAREEAKIVACDIDGSGAEATVEAVRAAGGSIVSQHPCDLTLKADCQAVVNLAIREYGRIDILYNNAAKAYFNPIEDISEEEWHQNTNVELNLVFLLTQAAWPHLKKSAGTIVNIASVTAWQLFPALPAMAHSTAKAGVVAMTRHMAMEGRDFGIRANSISPGVIETNQTRAQLENTEWSRQMLSHTLMGRVGQPIEIANVGLFLASDESSYINGADIRADGGTLI